MRRRFAGAELSPDAAEGRGIIVIAVYVTQQTAQLVESGAIDPAVFLETVVGPSAKLVEVPIGLCDADNRNIESSALHHGLEGRENLLIRQVAGCSEKDQGVGMGITHNASFQAACVPADFSSWPPN